MYGLLTKSQTTSISSPFSKNGAICKRAVKNWLDEVQFILILFIVISLG
jgi:hypothetical protein